MRAPRLALFPLWTMAACFFLPAIQDCGGPKSPLDVAVDANGLAVWAVLPYLFAAVFGVLTVLAVRQARVSLPLRRVALLSLALFGAGSLATSFVAEAWFPVAAAAGIAASIAVLRTARGRTPQAIWERLLAGFALIALGSGPTAALVIFHESALWGAWVYLASLGALLALMLTRVARGHPETTG